MLRAGHLEPGIGVGAFVWRKKRLVGPFPQFRPGKVMIEQFANLILTDTLTIGLMAVLAAIAAGFLGSALESNAAALAVLPVLMAFAILGNLVVTLAGFTEPLGQLTFRESDAAESLMSLSFTLLAVTTGLAIGCFLILRSHAILKHRREEATEA